MFPHLHICSLFSCLLTTYPCPHLSPSKKQKQNKRKEKQRTKKEEEEEATFPSQLLHVTLV